MISLFVLLMFFLYYNKKTRIPALFLLPEFSFICLYLLFFNMLPFLLRQEQSRP